MNEIEVGDYVRDKEGNITKILNLLNLDRNVYLYLGEDGYQYSDNSIKTHSKNKIDLVEVGDIVHIKDVLHEDIVYIWTEEYLEQIKEDINSGLKLLSILTHEQFKEREYIF